MSTLAIVCAILCVAFVTAAPDPNAFVFDAVIGWVFGGFGLAIALTLAWRA